MWLGHSWAFSGCQNHGGYKAESQTVFTLRKLMAGQEGTWKQVCAVVSWVFAGTCLGHSGEEANARIHWEWRIREPSGSWSHIGAGLKGEWAWAWAWEGMVFWAEGGARAETQRHGHNPGSSGRCKCPDSVRVMRLGETEPRVGLQCPLYQVLVPGCSTGAGESLAALK